MRKPLVSSLLLLCLFAQLNSRSTQSPSRAPSPYLLAMSVPDVEKTMTWYHDNLGFQVVEKMDLPNYEVKIGFMELNGFRLEIIEHRQSFSQEMIRERIPEIKDWSRVQGLVKFAFLVDKLAPWEESLRKNGVKFQTGIMKGKGSWGDSFIVLDNNGNWIQFAEKPQK